MTRRRWPIVAAVVALLVVIAGAVIWFFVLPDGDDPVADLETGKGSGAAVAANALDGTWTVSPGTGDEGTFAGYLVEEVFAAGARRETANGRTADVTGSVVVADGKVTTGSFRVDTTTLISDQGRRDKAIKDRGLETNRFPEASFVLTGPVTLPATMTDGNVTPVTITGDLTLHGVTAPITTAVDVRPLGNQVTLLARIPIAFDDYGIDAPSIGGFVEVENTGQIELRINLTKG